MTTQTPSPATAEPRPDGEERKGPDKHEYAVEAMPPSQVARLVVEDLMDREQTPVASLLFPDTPTETHSRTLVTAQGGTTFETRVTGTLYADGNFLGRRIRVTALNNGRGSCFELGGLQFERLPQSSGEVKPIKGSTDKVFSDYCASLLGAY